MSVIAFNFTKINAERKEQTKGQININNSVVIKDVVKTNLALGPQSQDVARVTFEFTSTYMPNRGIISLEGEVIELSKPDVLDSMVKSWKKDKKLPQEQSRSVINHILGKCNVEAIIISRELGLPSPIELPRIAAK